MGRGRHQWSVREFGQARSGNAGTELAMVAPILLLLLIGSIEIGRALRDYHVVNESVRDAARYLSRVAVSCPVGVGPGVFDNDAERLAGKALAMTGSTALAPQEPNLLDYWNYATDSGDLPGGTITASVRCLDNSGVEFAGLYASVNEVPVIDVVVQVPFTFLFGDFAVPDGTITFELAHTVVNTGG